MSAESFESGRTERFNLVEDLESKYRVEMVKLAIHLTFEDLMTMVDREEMTRAEAVDAMEGVAELANNAQEVWIGEQDNE
ncbi:MAG: hypothetical protein WA972_05900 [Rhodococcus qingshengii]|uniref:hypothetical protein n=1 Tax=Rhodococcus erythropolis TaxID=1833 RepID=UPI0030134910